MISLTFYRISAGSQILVGMYVVNNAFSPPEIEVGKRRFPWHLEGPPLALAPNSPVVSPGAETIIILAISGALNTAKAFPFSSSKALIPPGFTFIL